MSLTGLSRSSIKTQDEEFDTMWGNVKKLEEVVDGIKTHMTNYVQDMKAFINASYSIADDFKTFYERSPERLTTVALKYEGINDQLKTDKLRLLEDLVQKNVINKADDFLAQLQALSKKVRAREESRQIYEHYWSKLKDLRDAKDKARRKGKDLSGKEYDRLERNEKKFEDARLDFISYNCLVSRSLWDLWRNRFLIMDPIFDQVIKTKSMFIQAMGNQLSSVLPELKRCLAIPVHVDESLPPVLRAPPPDGLGKDVDERKLELRMRQAAEKIQETGVDVILNERRNLQSSEVMSSNNAGIASSQYRIQREAQNIHDLGQENAFDSPTSFSTSTPTAHSQNYDEEDGPTPSGPFKALKQQQQIQQQAKLAVYQQKQQQQQQQGNAAAFSIIPDPTSPTSKGDEDGKKKKKKKDKKKKKKSKDSSDEDDEDDEDETPTPRAAQSKAPKSPLDLLAFADTPAKPTTSKASSSSSTGVPAPLFIDPFAPAAAQPPKAQNNAGTFDAFFANPNTTPSHSTTQQQHDPFTFSAAPTHTSSFETDPFFSAPLPMPTPALQPQQPVQSQPLQVQQQAAAFPSVPVAAKATAPSKAAKKKKDKKKKKKRSTDDSDSEFSSSSSSSSSSSDDSDDSDQTEGKARVITKQPSLKVGAGANAVNPAPGTNRSKNFEPLVGGLPPLPQETSSVKQKEFDPFDFDANPTQSMIEARSNPQPKVSNTPSQPILSATPATSSNNNNIKTNQVSITPAQTTSFSNPTPIPSTASNSFAPSNASAQVNAFNSQPITQMSSAQPQVVSSSSSSSVTSAPVSSSHSRTHTISGIAGIALNGQNNPTVPGGASPLPSAALPATASKPPPPAQVAVGAHPDQVQDAFGDKANPNDPFGDVNDW